MDETPRQLRHDFLDPADRLESWKQIAAFLGKDEKTVRRWEKSEGLPIHRHPHQQRASIHASKREIEDWQRKRMSTTPAAIEESAQPSRSLWRYSVPLVVSLLVISGFVKWRRVPVGTVSEYKAVRVPTRFLSKVTSENTGINWKPLGAEPHSVIIPHNSDFAYVSLFDSSDVALIRISDNSLVKRIAVASYPFHLSTDPDGRYVVVGHDAVNAVSIIETSTGRVRIVKTEGRTAGGAIGRNGKAFLPLIRKGLWELDLQTGGLRLMPDVTCPIDTVLNREETLLYVACRCGAPGSVPGRDGVDIVDLKTEHSIGTAVGPPLVGGSMALSPRGDTLWIDGSDACQSPSYDHTGCPKPDVATGVGHVLRLSDRRFIHTLEYWPSNGHFVFEPGLRVALINQPKVRILDAVSFQPLRF